jgi:hypothetical protein
MILFYESLFQVIERPGVNALGIQELNQGDYSLGILFITQDTLDKAGYKEVLK